MLGVTSEGRQGKQRAEGKGGGAGSRGRVRPEPGQQRSRSTNGLTGAVGTEGPKCRPRNDLNVLSAKSSHFHGNWLYIKTGIAHNIAIKAYGPQAARGAIRARASPALTHSLRSCS